MSHIDFPVIPEMTGSFEYIIPQLTFREMLRKTWYAASVDESRKSLVGVLSSFKDSKLTMVATDGRRLALINHELEFPKEAEKDVILPPKVVSELQRILSNDGDVKIQIGVSPEQIVKMRQAQRANLRANGGEAAMPVKKQSKEIGRNDPCPCGSGKKYKQCCGKNQ
jgi:DNA polymerase III sliding clamp (beta) subunit (PCNA family)